MKRNTQTRVSASEPIISSSSCVALGALHNHSKHQSTTTANSFNDLYLNLFGVRHLLPNNDLKVSVFKTQWSLTVNNRPAGEVHLVSL